MQAWRLNNLTSRRITAAQEVQQLLPNGTTVLLDSQLEAANLLDIVAQLQVEHGE